MSPLTHTDIIDIERGLRSGIHSVFVEVILGKFTGTVGRVINIQKHNFTKISLTMDIGKPKLVTFDRAMLTSTDKAEIAFCYDPNHTHEHLDFNGRQIQVGQTVLYSKVGDQGGSDLCVATVKEVETLHIMLLIYGKRGKFEQPKEHKARVTKNIVIIDNDLAKHLMIARLSAN